MGLKSSDSILLLLLVLLLASMMCCLLPRLMRRWVLLAASYGCYCLFSRRYALLLFAVTVGSYALGLAIAAGKSEGGRWKCLLAGLVGCVSLLFAFKYLSALLPLFLEASQARGSWFWSLAVPLGLSFYTFRIVSYLVDIYWERYPAQRGFVAYATYVAFFPQIISGPIQRADDFFEQLEQAVPEPRLILEGMVLIALGCLKKVLADRLAVPVDEAFSRPDAAGGLSLLVAGYLFPVQLYFDFSGITDIALGAGLLLGIRGPANFEAPFFSANVQQFWRRWHMSLTGWLHDYVYMPLVMSLRGWGRRAVAAAILVNMLIMGIWHGPTTGFLAFGLIHALYLMVYAFTPALRRRLAGIPGWPMWSRLLTFHLVVVAFVFFRARSFQEGLAMLAGMLHAPWEMSPSIGGSLFPPVTLLAGACLVLLVVLCHLLEQRKLRLPHSPVACHGFIGLAMILVYVFARTEAVSFIYQMF